MQHDGSTREFPQHSFVYNYDDAASTDCHAAGPEPVHLAVAMASAPPMSEYSERDVLLQQQYQQQQYQQEFYQQQPSASQPPAFPPSAYYVPPPPVPSYRSDQDDIEDPPGFIHMMLKLTVFHLANAVLGIAGFVIVVTGASLSVGLLPLCCFGLVVLRILLVVIRYLAQVDVQLCNYISDPSDRVLVKLPRDRSRLANSGHALLSGRRLAPQLGEFSPLALMATLYFASIKFAIGIASCIVVTLFIAIPAASVGTLGDSRAVIQLGDYEYSMQDDPLAFAVALICLFVISLALMHLFARVSCAATRFFCAEKFTMTQFHFSSSSDLSVPAAFPVYTNAGPTYGSAGY
jgi:hypothetical protein